MIHIICDICKKHIPGATTTYSWAKRKISFRATYDKALCHTCQIDFDEEVKNTMEERQTYSLMEQHKVYQDVLQRMCR